MKETDNKTNAQSLPASNEKIQPVAPPITGKAKEKNLKKLEKTIDYSKIKEFKKEIESTLDILSGVLLTNKNLKKTKVVEKEISENILAKYNPITNEITLNISRKKEGFNDNFVIALLHEYAHKIDVEILGKGKGYASEMGAAIELMNVIESTDTVKRLENALKKYKINVEFAQQKLKQNKDRIKVLKRDVKEAKYLLEKKELLARVITQYLGKRSNSEKVLEFLNQKATVLMQFRETEFVEISKSLEPILKKAGLIK